MVDAINLGLSKAICMYVENIAILRTNLPKPFLMLGCHGQQSSALQDLAVNDRIALKKLQRKLPRQAEQQMETVREVGLKK